MKKGGIYFLVIGIVAGAIAAREYKPMLNAARDGLAKIGVVSPRLSPRIAHGRDHLQKNPIISTCPDPTKERVAVLLTAGQSNASSEGAVGEANDHVDNAAITNLWNGRCYLARHPLLGATGEAQSPWIETARLLLTSGKFDKVVIIATAIGGTGADEWATGGEFHARMMKRIAEAKTANLTPTYFLWHQGEHENVNRRSAEKYEADLLSIFRSVRVAVGSEIPIASALVSRCQRFGPNEEVRSAQKRAVETIMNAKIAIDSDAIGLAYRYDGCHFTGEGLDLLAAGYAGAILN